MRIKRDKIEAKDLYTKSAYSKKIGVSPGRITQMITAKDPKICLVPINGGTIIWDNKK